MRSLFILRLAGREATPSRPGYLYVERQQSEDPNGR